MPHGFNTVEEKIGVLVPCARSFLTFRESEGFTTFCDHARIESRMAEALGNLEAIFIANGIRLELEGEKLEEHVEQWLRQYEEREERSARRQEEALSAEFDKNLKEITERVAKAYEDDGEAASESAMGGTAEAPSHSSGR